MKTWLMTTTHVFALFATVALLIGVESSNAHACTTNSQCNDGNSCTVDYCSFGTCHHNNVANGTACNDGSSCTTNDTCYSGLCFGGPPPAEICTGGGANVDEDCDGLTDENVPVEGSTCEAPTGVFETNNWFKQRPSGTGLPVNSVAPGDPCDWGIECESQVCVRKNGSEAICAMRDEVTPPSGWVYAYVERGICPTSDRKVDDMFVPGLQGWSPPNPKHGFDGSCNSNSDCTSGICVRKSTFGRCGAIVYGTEPPCSGALATETNFDECYFCDVIPSSLCIPSAALCSPVLADACTWSSSWDCP